MTIDTHTGGPETADKAPVGRKALNSQEIELIHSNCNWTHTKKVVMCPKYAWRALKQRRNSLLSAGVSAGAL